MQIISHKQKLYVLESVCEFTQWQLMYCNIFQDMQQVFLDISNCLNLLFGPKCRFSLINDKFHVLSLLHKIPLNEGWEWFVYRQSPGQASFPDQGTQEIAFT